MTSHATHRRSKAARKPRLKWFYTWHGRIGVTAAIFVIWIVISGLLLNHSDDLHLAQRELHNSALARWYGLAEPLPRQVFIAGDHWLVNSGAHLILDGKALQAEAKNIIGMVASGPLLAVANQHRLLLFMPDGSLVDQLGVSDLPLASIDKLGWGCDGFVITHNTQILASRDGLNWQTCAEAITWAQPETIHSEQLAQTEHLLVPAISVEKLLIDLHTGRFFGRLGPYVVDIIGVCLLLLALSGLWLFARRSRRSK